MRIMKNLFKNVFSREECNHLQIKIEADFSADPIWCDVCGENLDIDDFSLSNELVDELFTWVSNYKKIPMELHNQTGLILTEKVRAEIAKDYHSIRFIAQ